MDGQAFLDWLEASNLFVIHLDVNSKNILIGKDQETLHFIDLGSAAYIDHSGQQKVWPDQPLGTPSPCCVDWENR